MAEFKALEPNIEIDGSSILTVIQAMGSFKSRGNAILEKHGLKNVKPEKWYPQQSWLDALKEIYEKIGPVTLKMVGVKIGETMPVPPGIESMEALLNGGDVRYHLDHRKNGKIMFDKVTGEMTEGIGHYKCEKTGDRSMTMVCSDCYPCVFDLGLAEGLLKRFKPKDSMFIKIEHDDTKECRRTGGQSCTHHISW